MDKKKIILIIVLGVLVCIILPIILIFTFVVGTKQGDWHYKLHNNYEIWRVNSKEITIGKREDNILKDTSGIYLININISHSNIFIYSNYRTNIIYR